MRNVTVLLLLLTACGSSSTPADEPGPAAMPDAVAADPGDAADEAASSPSMPALMPRPEASEPSAADDPVRVDVVNRCSETIDFCVEVGRSQKQTRLAASAHEVYRMRAGDTVRAYENQRCGDVIYEAQASPSKQEAVVCK